MPGHREAGEAETSREHYMWAPQESPTEAALSGPAGHRGTMTQGSWGSPGWHSEHGARNKALELRSSAITQESGTKTNMQRARLFAIPSPSQKLENREKKKWGHKNLLTVRYSWPKVASQAINSSAVTFWGESWSLPFQWSPSLVICLPGVSTGKTAWRAGVGDIMRTSLYTWEN